MISRRIKVLAPVLAISLIAAACGDSDDDTAEPPADTADEATGGAGDDSEEVTDQPSGEMTEDTGDTAAPATVPEGGELPETSEDAIIITGPERDESEAGSIQEVLGAWGADNGVEVVYLGDANWEANINVQVAGGNPPDISIFPQPGKLAEFARAGDVVALADVAATATADNWSEAWTVFGNVDGTQVGVPVKSDLKSLVWYQPARFEAAGYAVPETFDEFTALIDQMLADGGPKPLCVGIESGQATGWTYTDWVEDMVLRQHGPEVYDQWVSHEIPFNDERIVESMQTVLDLWTEDNVYANSGTIAATAFQDNGGPLVNGDCYMHRQASFYSAFIPEGTAFADGSEDAVDVFYFPDIDGSKPVLGAGTLAAAFNDRPEVHELLAYMATPDYAEARQTAQQALKGGGDALSGFLSAVNGQDPSVYQPLEQSFLDILSESAIVRFDASDLMPADVGAGSFWTEGTSAVNGDITAQEAADTIEASWPAG
ncbi:MAG: ABC transporter substrate-binding protein [Ilumatobacteraceae bacterium]|nr:ABC transporter substrate-binding protein [Ilumatobacteraceae bacterium]